MPTHRNTANSANDIKTLTNAILYNSKKRLKNSTFARLIFNTLSASSNI